MNSNYYRQTTAATSIFTLKTTKNNIAFGVVYLGAALVASFLTRICRRFTIFRRILARMPTALARLSISSLNTMPTAARACRRMRLFNAPDSLSAVAWWATFRRAGVAAAALAETSVAVRTISSRYLPYSGIYVC